MAAFFLGVLVIFALDLEGGLYFDVIFFVFVDFLLTSRVFGAYLLVILCGLGYLQFEFVNFLSVVVLVDLFDLKLETIQRLLCIFQLLILFLIEFLQDLILVLVFQYLFDLTV